MPNPTRSRLVLAGIVSVGLVAAAVTVPSFAHEREGSARTAYERSTAADAMAAKGLAPDGHNHRHDDPRTKNAISRAALTAGTQDPTTAKQAEANRSYVEKSRAMADPRLTTARVRDARATVPQNRYVMAGGCYRLRGEAIHFQATELGTYVLYNPSKKFLTGNGDRVSWADQPSADAEFRVRRHAGGFTFTLPGGRALTRTPAGTRLTPRATAYPLRRTTGCAAYPEIGAGVSGRPHAGVTDIQEVRGYVDAHTHGMAYEFLGGEVHCGEPWDRYGVAFALVDCQDHTLTNGKGAALEAVLSGRPTHDPVGWPTFKDWPAPQSLTHEGTYWKWMERSWRGGQRVFVNLLVENGQLCKIYPLKRNSCDEMTSIRLQAKRMRQFENYIDAQYGGPGKGWYRIVTSPWQARKVINEGKLAVIMGIETSVPFGCTFKNLPGGDVPACDVASIDAQLDEMHQLGVRQMELVNKFDNALTGVAGDDGETGVAVNSANLLETGSYWDMRACTTGDDEVHDRTQVAQPEISGEQQDALFGAIAKLSDVVNLPALPVYGPAPHCNQLGLSSLGEHLVNKLAGKHMLIDPDHMSVKARQKLLDILEARQYPGVLSSHSWSTPDAYPRIYRLGGFVAPYAGDSQGFYDKWQRHLGWADKRFYFGFGYGADMNGLGAQGDPRGAGVSNPVTYPFTGLHGVKVTKQRSGTRVYDINVEGVPHYGMYPDWIQDLRKLGGRQDGSAIVDDMDRGAEAYLQMWERAEGVHADACRNPGLRVRVARFGALVRPGMTTREVQRAVGQPYTRLGSTYGTCARTAGDPRVMMRIAFGPRGRVTDVRRAN
ncbi:MAG: hypothetical protein ABWX84_04925 [Nocardioides sp.]